MNREELIDAVLARMEVVWGDEGLNGTTEEYEWLLKHCGISEEEDVQWQLVLELDLGELSESDSSDPEVREFVDDDAKVIPLLQTLLLKYESTSQRYQQ